MGGADLSLARRLVCAYSKYDRLEGDIRLNDGTVVPRHGCRDPFGRYLIC